MAFEESYDKWKKMFNWTETQCDYPLQNVLRVSSRKQLARHINIKSEILSHNGQCPDFRGLAELIGFDYLDVKQFETASDPTSVLLDEWNSTFHTTATMGKLCDYLEYLGRVDCLQDCQKCFQLDMEAYESRYLKEEPLQESTVSQSKIKADDMSVKETDVITTDDVISGTTTYYDAFVCYAKNDLWFVQQMITKLESPPHNLKLCIVDRDVIPGSSKHTINAKLIEDRCKRIVAILSTNFLKSNECDFQMKFAHSLSPGSRQKKLIPLIIEYCTKYPKILHQITPCDFTKGDMHEWAWKRLASAIKAPFDFSDYSSNDSELNELTLKLPLCRSLSVHSKNESTS
ncbi:myeloid differentiation primary response 88-like isoform X1 [Octopus vulgaris]|uniref:Myeloid differentiation primary response 88-like isoform X1 n=1 Tax=Octopus vulgaris TaxID=6645 RepID=A0AA36AYU3_OCTVU|nr:myeloid differentiation primary response 88-like isoform X1 [Octopus vulgaris]